jgi:galactose mutarotase-like enzyme
MLRAGDLEAHVLPDVGMLISSLRHRGDELLAQRAGVDEYRRSGRSFGIPLLHPWANRLGGFAYTAAGRRVSFSSTTPRVRVDAHGLPLHGLLAASPYWSVRERTRDRCVAELDYGAHCDLLVAFPFPHRLRLGLRLDAGGLDVALRLSPAGERVPTAFGFHPWFALAGGRREDWLVALPQRERLVLDARGLPTGKRRHERAERAPLRTRVVDEAYAGLPRGAAFAVTGGGRRVSVTLVEGYPCAQLFAPAAEDVICFEPMTAPPNALVTGDGLRIADTPFTARFRIGVEPRA